MKFWHLQPGGLTVFGRRLFSLMSKLATNAALFRPEVSALGIVAGYFNGRLAGREATWRIVRTICLNVLSKTKVVFAYRLNRPAMPKADGFWLKSRNKATCGHISMRG
ncbi:MAG TPA: hypothetical protein VHQ92_18280 [Pseudolabrys sp.]|nr:hypothetical protein [Pseudolabrys sp.]